MKCPDPFMCLIDFYSAKMFFTIACFLAILQAEGSTTTKKQNYVDSKATSCSRNINTEPNKKLEDILLGIKQQLDEIQEELRHLTKKEENNTDGKKLAFSLSSSSQEGKSPHKYLAYCRKQSPRFVVLRDP